MEMKEMFYQNAYLKELNTKVLSCTKVEDHYEVLLEDTIFYPEGGGQPCDLGTINGIEVYDVRRNSQDQVIHYLKQEVSKDAQCKLDWQRRFDHMQAHSGEHLVSGLIHQKYGYENVGFHMGEVIQIDFDGPLEFKDLREIENRANELICLNEEIEVFYPSSNELVELTYRSKKELSGTVRIIKIPQSDVCACCGTHVKRTGEIGLVRILTCEKHKNGFRATMLAGRKALLYDQRTFDQNHEISVLLSAKPLETSSFVKGLLDTIEEQKYQMVGIQKELMHYQLQSCQKDAHLEIVFTKGISREMMRVYANALVDEYNVQIAAICNEEENRFGYFILSHCVDLSPYRNDLNHALHGQGGGSKELLQGNFMSCREDIEDVLKQYLEEKN